MAKARKTRPVNSFCTSGSGSSVSDDGPNDAQSPIPVTALRSASHSRYESRSRT